MPERLHVIIQGFVQGVGFRYSAARRARELGLDGWVRNLDDGRVEAEFIGPRPNLEDMLDWCRLGSAYAHVSNVEESWSTADAHSPTGFHIRA